MKVCTY